jgi:hypothetical protein
MIASADKVWDLIKAGHYLTVLEHLRRRESLWTDADWREADRLGTVLLCLRRYAEAAVAFQKSEEMACRNQSFSEGLVLTHWGGACWLAGDKIEAVSLWRQSVRGISDGTFTRADASGGIKNALLLWYGGVSLPDADASKDAMKFLKKASKRVRAKNMPGPMAGYVLGHRQVPEILSDAWSTSDLEELLARAKADVLLRRRLCAVLLCWATGERLAGRESETRRLMKLCAGMENPLVEIEWFLARGEAELN